MAPVPLDPGPEQTTLDPPLVQLHPLQDPGPGEVRQQHPPEHPLRGVGLPGQRRGLLLVQGLEDRAMILARPP